MAQIDFLGDPIFQAVDGSGVPIAGGLVWCYSAGTDDLKDMYATIADAINQLNPLPNPMTLNSDARASIVYAGASKFILEGSEIDPDTGHGPLIWTADNVGRFGNTVIDPNGNIIVEYSYLNDAVNYVKITNAPSSINPIIEYTGADAEVGGTIKLKGTTEGLRIESDNSHYTLPPIDGASGTMLTTDGVGSVTWSPPPGVTAILPPGFVLDFANTVAPSGWLPCNGAAVSRSTYSDLFTAIGVVWGAGDGVNTFNVPDCRRKIRMGSGGTGTAVIGNAVSNTGGTETVTLTTAQMPAHTHTYNTHTVSTLNLTLAGGPVAVAGNLGPAFASTSTGGGGSHNNLPPATIFLVCIKT